MARSTSFASIVALAALCLSPLAASAGSLPTSTDEARRLAVVDLAPSQAPVLDLVTTSDEARLAAASRVVHVARIVLSGSVTSTDEARIAAGRCLPAAPVGPLEQLALAVSCGR